MNMVGKKMALVDAALLLFGQFAKHFAQMLPKVAVKHLPAAFGDKDNMVLATWSGLSSHASMSGLPSTRQLTVKSVE